MRALASLVLAASLAHPAFTPDGWRLAVPGYTYRFPRDHGAHPDYKTEWWYYTGHLETASGRRFGFEVTFFRVAVARTLPRPTTAWDTHDVQLAHYAISDLSPGTFHAAERTDRSVMGLATSSVGDLRVGQSGWHVERAGQSHHLVADDAPYRLDVTLSPAKPLVLHGARGVSQKSSGYGAASHYYSFTRLEGQGTIAVNGKPEPVKVLAWMDHEWGSNQLAPDEVGWDWLSLQLDDKTELMLYLLRRKDGTVVPQSSGTVVMRSGTSRHLPLSAYQVQALGTWKSPHTGAVYPSGWQVRVPSEHVDLQVQPEMADQELVTEKSTGVAYWEGTVRVQGQGPGGRSVKGQGYIELTGYDPKRRPRF